MALSANSTRSRTVLATALIASAGLAAFATQVRAVERPDLAPAVAASAEAPIVASVRERMPRGLRSRIQASPQRGAQDLGWVSLPNTLDGRVRLSANRSGTPGEAGWEMLDVPAIERIAVDGGAVYPNAEWDVVQLADQDRLREYIVVNEHQGPKTWRWRLHGASNDIAPRLRADGFVDLGHGIVLRPPVLLDQDLDELTKHVAWQLTGRVLSLTFDDRSLELPYVIDPDATPPAVSVAQAGVTVAPTTLAIDETGPTSATYTVVLDSEPTGPVTITPTADADSVVTPASHDFDASNWMTPKTFTVEAVDDLIFENTHTSTVTHAAASPDTNYQSPTMVVADVVATVTDNDIPGIEVDPPSGAVAATEGGTDGTYRIRLKTQPTVDVTIEFDTGTQVDAVPDHVFTTANWNVWFDVPVVATDDQVDEDTPHAGLIKHTVDTVDTGYAPLTIDDRDVDITDDDTAGIVIDDLGGVAVNEAGATSDTFTVVLESEPLGTVTVTPVFDAAQVALSATPPLPLVFTPANWNVAQTVTVAAIDDVIDEIDPMLSPISFTVSAPTDPKYAPITPTSIDASIADDDVAAVVFTPALPGPLAVDETGPTTATYNVVLATEPAFDVTISLAPTQVGVDAPSLVFTPTDWNIAKTVTVTALDDDLVEATPHAGDVQHAITSTDPFYGALTAAPMQLDITDNDVAEVEVDDMGGPAVTEGGATATYRVRLKKQPTGDVVVTPAPNAQVTVDPATPLTFTNADWNTWQVVTVTAFNDFVDEGPHTGQVAHALSSVDPLWPSSIAVDAVDVDITDDDTAGVTVTQAGPYAMAEQTPNGTDATYQVVLDSQPTDPVTITLAAPGDVTFSPPTLTFTALDWNVAQDVTINVVDDMVVEGLTHTRTVTHEASSLDPKYTIAAGVVDDVDIDITDNDIPGITVTHVNATLQLEEGADTDTFSIVLDTEPTADVVVALTGTQVEFAPASSITFTSANWNMPQSITVNAVDDAVDEHPDTHAGLIEFGVTSVDTVYHGWSSISDITAAIVDNDTAGVTVTPGATAIAVAEAGTTTATYQVVLDTEPTADVSIAVATADGQTTAAPAPLTFTPADWDDPQTVTVTAVDDQVDESDPHAAVVTHVATSADTHYAGITVDDQVVAVADDDTAAVTVTPTTGLTVNEAGATSATFTVVLATKPVDDVVVAFTNDAQVTLDLPSVTFTPADWNVAKTVTVTAVDDAIDEDAMVSTIVTETTSATDTNYDGIATDDVAVDVVDDDTAAILVTESTGSTDVTEGTPGVTDTYEVKLATQPTSDVTVAVTGGLQASALPTPLTFTSANWNTAQIVTVAAAADFLIEGAHTQLFTNDVTTGDAKYTGLVGPTVTANITDDDVAGVDITPTTVDVDEDGATQTYAVKLTAEPTADVTITLVPNAQVTASAMTLLFTPLNWMTAQNVTVGAVNDFVVEGNHSGTISHTISSADLNFNAVTAISDVIANIVDNDIPGVTVAPTSVSTAEAGTPATYDVQLESLPSAPVDVTFADPDNQLEPIANVTIAPGDWNVPHPVSVTATDDFVDEGPHAGTVEHDVASADANYAPGSLTIDETDVAITDNDTAAILVTPPSGITGAEGAVVTYQVALGSEPTADVTITLADDADGEVTAPTGKVLTFTPANWATLQTVEVTLTQDQIDEGAHNTLVTHAVVSADAKYLAIVVPAQDIAITDDDTAGIIMTPVSPGPIATAEGGAPASYTFELTSEPTADVEIDVTALTGQVAATPNTLTFTAANWMTAQTVNVSAIDDSVDEDAHGDTLTHTANSLDTKYSSMPIGDMTVDIADNDTAALLVTPVGPDTTVAEGGATDTFEVKLATQPTADVTVAFTNAQVTTAPAGPLTFTSTNWNAAQIVTVTAVDDAVDEADPHPGSVDTAATSVDGKYDTLTGATVSVSIADNDTAGVTITPPGNLDLVEQTPVGAPEVYKIKLDSEPTAPVDVVVNLGTQVAAMPGAVATVTLTFTPGNWNIDQDVAVVVVDDASVEAPIHPGTVTHDTSSTDPNYGTGTLTIDDVVFNVQDNDIPGITIDPITSHTVAEGGATSTYTIVLESQPSADVVISPTGTQLTWSVPNVTFTATNWNTPQTVILEAIDDAIDETDPHPGTLVHAVTSADANYTSALAANADATIGDNDVSDLVATPTSGQTVTEDGVTTATYTLQLTSEPTADVVVTIATDGSTSVAPATVTFTPLNWNATQNVVVSGVQDDIDQGVSFQSTITHAMASSDTFYDGEAGPDVVVDVTNDDTAGVTITPSGTTDVDEDGATDTYDVELDSEPTGNVTITLAVADGQTAPTPATLTFTPANWDTAQTVTVEAVDDDVVESTSPATHTGTITHAASGADPTYDASMMIDPVTVNILDNDAAGIVATPAAPTVDEDGGTEVVTITLTSEPTEPVDVTVAVADAQLTIDGATVPVVKTIAPADWAAGATVTVGAVDDGMIEGTHTGGLTYTAASVDTYYTGLAPLASTATIGDNDTATVTVTPTTAGTPIAEAGETTDTVNVVLDASPGAGETVTITPASANGQFTFTPATLVFDDTNWDDVQPVTVKAIDDAVDEADPHADTLTFTVASADVNWALTTTAPSAAVAVADNDTSGVTVTPQATPLAIAEAATTSQTFDVVLDSQPGGDVTIDLAQPGVALSGATLTGSTLTFTSANWNTAQTVTVTAIDDQVDQGPDATPYALPVTVAIASASDPLYDALADQTVAVDVTDDDSAGVNVVEQSAADLTVSETGPTSGTFDVTLDTIPSAPITVTFTSDAESTVAPASVTIQPGDWNVPTTVTVTAVDDQVQEGPHTTLLSWTVAGDAEYAALAGDSKNLDVIDDDVAAINVTASSPYAIDEQTPCTTCIVTMALATQPAGDVTITPVNADGDLVLPAPLVFTPANWATPQSFDVTAIDDSITEGAHDGTLTFLVDSTDAFYDVLTVADVVANITDDDIPGWVLDPVAPSLALLEQGATSGTYQLSMQTEPSTPITVTPTPADPAQVEPIAPIVFTAANWNTPQTVTVTAVDDPDVEAATHTTTIDNVVTGVGPYASLPIAPVVDVAITDNDVAGATVAPAGTTVNEAGATNTTFTVVLDARPTSDVSVAITELAATAGQTTLAPTGTPTLTFTNANWDQPQTVTITAVDDQVDEPATHPSTYEFATTSAHAEFDGLTIADLTFDVTDDDAAGVVLTDDTGVTLAEEGPAPANAHVVKVRLASQPTGNVTVDVTTTGQLTAPASLTFTPGNWNVDQDIAITAVDDALVEGPHSSPVTLTMSGADPLYTALPPRIVNVAITDTDTANLTFVAPATFPIDVTEGGAPVQVELGVQGVPSADVVITATFNAGQLSIPAATYTIPAGSMAAAPYFDVSAFDDSIAEGTHNATITWSIASLDPAFSVITLLPTDVVITDNDAAGIAVNPTAGLAVTEGGATTTFTVALTSQPAMPVVIEFDGGTQLTAAGTTPKLTFTQADWGTAQTVTVAAVDDPDVEGGHGGTLTATVTTTDAQYGAAAVAPAPIAVAITDNDVATVLVEQTGGSNAIAEGGTTDTLAVKLGARPSTSVTITPTADNQSSFAPASLTFTPANWDTAQTFTVTATQDTAVEGTHSSKLTFALESTDAAWGAGSAATPAAQDFVVTDDDKAGVKLVESGGATKVAEGGATDEYTVELTGQPIADVTMKLDGSGQVTTAPETLTFTAANWNVPQTVTVTAVQDDVDEADPHTGAITHVITTSAAGAWTELKPPSLGASITDDDASSIKFAQTGDATKVAEGGAGDTITMQLTSRPTEDVIVTATPDPQLSVGNPVTFTKDKWKEPVTLQIGAVDDEDVEGPHTGGITFEVKSGDATYGKQTIPALDVAITDNDKDTGATHDGEDEESEEDTEEITPTPPTPPARPTPRTPRSDASRNRTESGADRTESGRVPAPRAVPQTGGGAASDEGQSAGRFDGESSADKKKEQDAKKGSDPIGEALDWIRSNWKLVAPLALLALIVAGAGTWLARSNPMRGAQRAARSGGAAGAAGAAGKMLGAGGGRKEKQAARAAARAAKGSASARGSRDLHARPRKKRRRKDEDEDDNARS